MSNLEISEILKIQELKIAIENAEAKLAAVSAKIAELVGGDKPEVTLFLTYVVQGLQDKAEDILKKTPEIAMIHGTVTDHAGRKFPGMTGLQVALCNLDWHMWEMILKYMPLEVIKDNLKDFICNDHYKKLQAEIVQVWSDLIREYKTYEGIEERFINERIQQWVEVIGGLQKKLPIHVLQEYFHPTRAFYGCTPEMFKDLMFSRRDFFDEDSSSPISFLGENYAILRGNHSEATGYSYPDRDLLEYASLAMLLAVREQQRDKLLKQLDIELELSKETSEDKEVRILKNALIEREAKANVSAAELVDKPRKLKNVKFTHNNIAYSYLEPIYCYF